uniref:VPS37 C-terminal domain-containing protein n=1 Tax=Parascaris equorum TaxID=6256 RepID=A0A914S388_PAREQ
MQKRRERIERWRQERKKKEDGEEAKVNEEDIKERKWTLDNEEEDDENYYIFVEMEVKKEEEDEVDPLDAYMSEVNKEVRATKYGSDQVHLEVDLLLNYIRNTFQTVRRISKLIRFSPSAPRNISLSREESQVVDDFDIEKAASSLIARGRQLPQTDHSKVELFLHLEVSSNNRCSHILISKTRS